MAYSLFVDSSDNLTLGLLDNELSWLHFKKFENKKSSGVFHGLVDELLEAEGTNLFDLDRVFYGAGPGSYTGIRLVEGFGQILKWRQIKTNSFYLFDLPKSLGIDSGYFISEAYKGEFFLHSWDGSDSKNELIKKTEIKNHVDSSKPIFSCSDFNEIETKGIFELLENEPVPFFKEIISSDRKEDPFYYRAIDKEFTKPKSHRKI